MMNRQLTFRGQAGVGMQAKEWIDQIARTQESLGEKRAVRNAPELTGSRGRFKQKE